MDAFPVVLIAVVVGSFSVGLLRPLLSKKSSVNTSQTAEHEETHVDARLSGAKTTRDSLDRNALVNRILGGTLTFQQVVVGGLLTGSPFLADNLPALWAGIAGVAVLLAQLIRRQFDFQGSVAAAEQKSSLLSIAIRKAEDDLASIREAPDDATDLPSENDVTYRLSQTLNQIDSLGVRANSD